MYSVGWVMKGKRGMPRGFVDVDGVERVEGALKVGDLALAHGSIEIEWGEARGGKEENTMIAKIRSLRAQLSCNVRFRSHVRHDWHSWM